MVWLYILGIKIDVANSELSSFLKVGGQLKISKFTVVYSE